MNCMMRWVDVYEVPNNSQVRVQIQHWLCEVAELKVHEADQAWLLAQEKAKSIQGPLPQEIVTPNPPTLSHLHIPPFLPAGRGSCVRILINRNCLGNVFFLFPPSAFAALCELEPLCPFIVCPSLLCEILIDICEIDFANSLSHLFLL